MKIKQILLVFVGVVAAVTFGSVISAKNFGDWAVPVNAESIPGTSSEFNTSLSTPGTGILSAPVFARASFADLTAITFKVGKGREQEIIQVRGAQETVIQQIVIAPGGQTGWHSHPGPVVVLIKSGQMSFYDSDDPACRVITYSAGQSFIDKGQGHVHIARNESQTENLELWATYFDVPTGGAFRIDAPNPGNCSF